MCAIRDKKPGFDSEFTGTELKIKLRGEIDHHSAVAVRGAIDEMLRSKRPSQLVIDMSGVDFMDSSGLGLIMGRYAVMRELGGRLLVADPSPATEKIMSLAGMERIIKIVHSVTRENDKNKVLSKIETSPRKSSNSKSENKIREGRKREVVKK